MSVKATETKQPNQEEAIETTQANQEEAIETTQANQEDEYSYSEYSEDEQKENGDKPQTATQKKVQEPKSPNSSYRRHSLTLQPQQIKQESKEKPSSYAAAPSVQHQNSNLQNLRNLAKKCKPLPTNNVVVLNELLDSFNEDRKQLAAEGNFQGSVTIMKVIDHVKEYLQIAEKKEFQRRQQNEVRKENNIVHSRMARFDLETKNLEKNLKKNIAKSRERLINELRKEGEEQEKYWESESHMRLYNRPSNQLRLLRHQANQMVACGRFKDAEEVLRSANKLQEKEERQGSYQMQQDYENAMKLFNERVKEELHTFDQDAVNQIQSLRARRATMRTVYQNQERKVEQHEELVKDVDRCWNANLRSIVNEKIDRNLQHPEEMICTTRSLGKNLRDKQDNIILTLPKLHTKKVMESPIPTPDYL